MPWPLLALALGGGMGGAKSIGDIQSRNNAKKLNAAKARYSPWTGSKPGALPSVSVIGNLMQGGMAGLQAAGGIKGFAGKGAVDPGITPLPAEPAEMFKPTQKDLTAWDYMKGYDSPYKMNYV